MKKYSAIGVAIRHPLKTLLRAIVIFIVLFIGLALLGVIFDSGTIDLLFIVSLILSAYSLKRRYNKGYMEMFGSEPKEKPKKKKSLVFGMMNHMSNSVDGFSSSVGNAVGGAFTNSFSNSSRAAEEARYRAQKQQADAAARARWDALDRQKKAEWDARDAALRGKDKAAYQYQNQADYWRNQGRR